MMTAEEAKKYIKEFVPSDEIINSVESQIKRGERHVQVFTTRYTRSYAEDCAKYFRKLGYDAKITDIYNLRTGQRGGNYLQIDL
jgi:ATP-dependent RNA circularization protein (DNA/RNA ligase family)